VAVCIALSKVGIKFDPYREAIWRAGMLEDDNAVSILRNMVVLPNLLEYLNRSTASSKSTLLVGYLSASNRDKDIDDISKVKLHR